MVAIKYDILGEYREYLRRKVKNKNTADRYYFAVDKLLKDKQFASLGELEPNWIKDKISNVRQKNNFSAIKNGLKHLAKFDRSFAVPEEDFFRGLSRHKRNRTLRPAKTLYLDKTRKKINSLRNDKLKLAYRLMLVSGLRVSEAAQLTKKDIEINGDNITVNVLYGKGGSNGKVNCQSDKYLAQKLSEYMESKSDDENLFYSASTMKREAYDRDLECHDLRRIAAITFRKQQMQDGASAYEANAATKDFLRHKRFSTTKRYLFNRKLKFKNVIKEGDNDGATE